jgi:hypothetical protein
LEADGGVARHIRLMKDYGFEARPMMFGSKRLGEDVPSDWIMVTGDRRIKTE